MHKKQKPTDLDHLKNFQTRIWRMNVAWTRTTYGITFVGLNKEAVPYVVSSIVARLHETLEHPDYIDSLCLSLVSRMRLRQGCKPSAF